MSDTLERLRESYREALEDEPGGWDEAVRLGARFGAAIPALLEIAEAAQAVEKAWHSQTSDAAFGVVLSNLCAALAALDAAGGAEQEGDGDA